MPLYICNQEYVDKLHLHIFHQMQVLDQVTSVSEHQFVTVERLMGSKVQRCF